MNGNGFEESHLGEMICELPSDFGSKNEFSAADSTTEHDLVDSCGVSTFVAKLWTMLHDATARQYIKWADCTGDKIIIVDHIIFSTRILSRFIQQTMLHLLGDVLIVVRSDIINIPTLRHLRVN